MRKPYEAIEQLIALDDRTTHEVSQAATRGSVAIRNFSEFDLFQPTTTYLPPLYKTVKNRIGAFELSIYKATAFVQSEDNNHARVELLLGEPGKTVEEMHEEPEGLLSLAINTKGVICLITNGQETDMVLRPNGHAV